MGSRDAGTTTRVRLPAFGRNLYVAGHAVEGRCEGTLTQEPDGTQGFGYDPIFIPEGSNKTFGRMSIKEKSQYSHRARAIHLIIPYLISEFRKIPSV